MKLFVWRDVLCDYTCGIAFAMAETEERARKLIAKGFAEDTEIESFAGWALRAIADTDPDVYDEAYGTAITGGG